MNNGPIDAIDEKVQPWHRIKEQDEMAGAVEIYKGWPHNSDLRG